MTRTKRLLQAAGATAILSLALGASTGGCLNRPIDRINPRTTSTVVERLLQSGVDKIDLLLMVDNSISMADKQQILAAAVPDLVNRLVTPNCVDDMGAVTGVTDAAGECPDGSKPEFPPIRNINVGIISSSLGDLTSGSCASTTVVNPDDAGHLLTRPAVATFKDQGFLAWDPDNQRGGETVATALISNLGDLVTGVDQVGCGYEMGMEAILRFLVDPDPYASLMEENNNLTEVGTDSVVIEQRKNFLRPDSLLAIIMLSDENDCSVDVSGQGFLALGGPFYRSTSECKTDPNDECCKSCGLEHDGCDAGGDCATAKYTPAEDHPNLKCFKQKERYGVNFLYPVSRYVNAFTQPNIDPTKRDYSASDPDKAVDNPVFSDLSGGTGTIRSPDLVFVAGIVGVPWQAIARRDDSDAPDLSLGFKTFAELEPDLEYLIGDPDTAKYPGEPFMQESTTKRSGTSTLTGASLPGTNAINGNDYNISTMTPNDLEYACIFPLTTPVPNGADCDDCIDASCDKPLCNGTTQEQAKAYPGLRELAWLRGMGSQGIFASICPAEVDNTGSPIYGYRPAVNTIIDRLKEELGGQCLPRELTVDDNPKSNTFGQVPCLVIEAVVAGSADCCGDIGGRVDIPKNKDGKANPNYNAVVAAQNSDFANPDWNCFCEITQLSGDAQETCQNEADPQATSQGDGWCYVAATDTQQIGDPALVATCPDTERRLVRFVGKGDPRIGSTVIVTCSGE